MPELNLDGLQELNECLLPWTDPAPIDGFTESPDPPITEDAGFTEAAVTLSLSPDQYEYNLRVTAAQLGITYHDTYWKMVDGEPCPV